MNTTEKEVTLGKVIQTGWCRRNHPQFTTVVYVLDDFPNIDKGVINSCACDPQDEASVTRILLRRIGDVLGCPPEQLAVFNTHDLPEIAEGC